MTRQIADFATARSEAPEWVDVNAIVKAVCDFLSFDRRFRGVPIEFRPDVLLPACELAPDFLNEIVMSLLQACAEADAEDMHCERIRVETEARGDHVVIRLVCDPASASVAGFSPARLTLVRRRVEAIGGQLAATATTVEFQLPPSGGKATPG